MSKAIVISAFPACGKSYMYNNYNGKPYTMLDSDSSQYSWLYDKDGNKTDMRNPNFINDYINHIKSNLDKVDVIFVSSHKDVRKALRDNNIYYYLFYPALDMKDTMLARMNDRGNTPEFIKFQEEHFEAFITEIENEIFSLENITLAENNNAKFLAICLDKTPYITNEYIDYLIKQKEE